MNNNLPFTARLRKIADRLEDAGCMIQAAEVHQAADALGKLVPSAHENRRLLDLAERGAHLTREEVRAAVEATDAALQAATGEV